MNAPAHSWTTELASAIRIGDPRWVAPAGRIVLVWVPCYTLMGYRFGSSPTALAVRTSVGAVTGMIGVSAVALWVPGLGMSTSTILALTLSVFALTTIW